MTPPRPLLALFTARFGDSRLAELEAVARRLGAPELTWTWEREVLATKGGDIGPSVVQPLPVLAETDQGWLADAAARAVACRGVFEVWGEGDSIEDCAASTHSLAPAHVQARVDGSWRVESVVLGARGSRHPKDLGRRMVAFGHVLDALEGRPVDLNASRHQLWLVEDRRVAKHGGAPLRAGPRFRLLFKLPVTRPAIRELVWQLDLRRRAFLSTSSTPADRALLLCNLGLATAPEHDALVLDPYCGSGSILLAAAALGAKTVGSDLDWKMVSDNRVPQAIPASPHRPERGVESVRMRDNFDEAGLPAPLALLTLDVGAEDAATHLLEATGGRPYDALVCDPPYGRREFQQGAEAWDGALTFKVDEAALTGTLTTLLDLAEATLRPGGRLVFLAPVRSPRDAHKPPRDVLHASLVQAGGARGLQLVHLGVEVVHGGLHRAVVVMARDA